MQAKLLAEIGLPIAHVIFLDCPDWVVAERVEGRRSDPVSGKVPIHARLQLWFFFHPQRKAAKGHCNAVSFVAPRSRTHAQLTTHVHMYLTGVGGASVRFTI